MTVDAHRRARAAVARVAADGTDPGSLLAVLAWLVRPRRSPDALRRACRDLPASAEPPALRLEAAAGVPTTAMLAAVEQAIEPWRSLGVRVALVGDASYPERLAAGWPDTDGPPLLACRGAPHPAVPAAALVGARRASSYGVGVAAWLAEAVGRAGIRIVSGGALGIDAAAHRAALDTPGGTTVVLGCGHGVPYPREHAAVGGLFDRVLEHGGSLVSELLPLQRPVPGNVRARNRIVAALTDALVVVEGGSTSGALVTASAAADRGIPVLAVPGDVRAPGSAAPHRLLSEGAAPCTAPSDLLDALGTGGPSAAGPEPEPARPRVTVLPDEVHRALADAWPRALRVDDLAAATGRPAPQLLAALTRAQLVGEVAEGPDGVRLRRAPDAAKS